MYMSVNVLYMHIQMYMYTVMYLEGGETKSISKL